LVVQRIMPTQPPAQKSTSQTHGPPAFSRFAKWISINAGRPAAFLLAAFVIIAWAVTGPLFDYSDTWQLIINTGTTIVTFLMVFLIQNTQNRESQALHVKLDELIRAISGARNSLIDLDKLSDEELSRIQEHYAKLAKKSKNELRELQDDSVALAAVTKKKG
jgi:low affinity Fe/Cu permease